MTASKQVRAKKPPERRAAPKGCRPTLPKEYGIPASTKALLPWSHVTDRMVESKCYWVATVSPDGRPFATPVDGIWLEESLYFGGSLATRRSRNLVANPATCVHLESGTDVVILHGESLEVRSPGIDLAGRLAEASQRKYGYGWKPEDYQKMPGLFRFRPRAVLAWKKFPVDVTRWQFAEEE